MTTDLLIALGKANVAAGAAIVAVIAVRKLVRKVFGAKLAYALWLAAPLAAIAVLLPARLTILPTPATAGFEPVPTVLLDTDITAVAAPAVAAAAPLDLGLIFSWFWIAGAAVMAAWLMRKQAAFMADARVGKAGPAVVGVIRPRIVTPSNFAEVFTDREQAVVLAHETTHIARQDVRANALAALVQCVCWFNPLIHVAARLMRIDQELACDAQVVERHPKARRTYAEAMLKAELAGRPLPLGCCWPAGTEHPLTERIAMLKHDNPSRRRRIAGAVSIAALCALGGLAAWAAQPERIEYAPPEPSRTAPLPQDGFVPVPKEDGFVPVPQTAPVRRDGFVPVPGAEGFVPVPGGTPEPATREGFVPVPTPSRTEGYLPVPGGTPEPIGATRRIERPTRDRAVPGPVDNAPPAGGYKFVPGGTPEPATPAPVDRFVPVPKPDRAVAVPVPSRFVPEPTVKFPPPAPWQGIDKSAPVTLQGTITDVTWINPSVLLHVTDASGKRWLAATATPNTFLSFTSLEQRPNLKRIVARDVKVTLTGFLPQDRSCNPECGVFADPRNMTFNGEKLGPAPAGQATPVPTLFVPIPEPPQPAPVATQKLPIQAPFPGWTTSTSKDNWVPITISGTITDVKWVNPSTQIFVRGDDGRNWYLLSSTPNAMLRSGGKRDVVKKDARIVVQAQQDLDIACAPLCVAMAQVDKLTVNGAKLSSGVQPTAYQPDEPQKWPEPLAPHAYDIPESIAHLSKQIDATAPLTIQGTVMRVEWVNPSTQIHVQGSDGQEWVVGSGTPNSLLRAGVNRDYLAKGTALTISGLRGLNKACDSECVMFADPAAIVRN